MNRDVCNRDSLTRQMKWMIADKLASETLEQVNNTSKVVEFEESFYTKYTKRVLDIVISSTAIIVTAPIELIVAIVTYFDVGRPILFEQQRIGKNEKLFTLKKYRNMTNEKDENGELLPPNMRVTKWGKFVRKYSLDELMNFVNILRGDMSVIGPRPLDEPYLARFSERHKGRFFVKPGLECPPKDLNSHNRTWNDQFENDLWYVENVSFVTDVKLLINLIKFTFDNKYSEMRAQATRGDFLGYSVEGKAISQYELPEEYLSWITEKYKQQQ